MAAERIDFDEEIAATLIMEGEEGLKKRLCGGSARVISERVGIPLAEIQEWCGHDHVNETPDKPVADLPRRVTLT